MKTKKAITKRYKITGTGKIMRRPSGQDHFNAKASSDKRRAKRRFIQVTGSEAKMVRRYLTR